MNEPPLCIYHANCIDGFAAAWAIRKYFSGRLVIDFHPGIYGEPPPDVTGRTVYLVDFSYKRATLIEMAEQAETITIIDHHKTAADDLVDLPANVRTIFDMARSGAMLTWNEFFPKKLPPVLFDHIQDRDLWQFKLPGTREITAAIYSYPMDFAVWDVYIDRLRTLYNEGTAILRKHDADVDALAHACTRTAYFRGVPAPIANVPYMYASDVGAKLAQGQAFAATYYDDQSGRRWSLRATPEGADVSQIAEAFGGGGHRNAAGFRMTPEEAIEFEMHGGID